jgi:hypothetical protein
MRALCMIEVNTRETRMTLSYSTEPEQIGMQNVGLQ